MPEHGPSVKLTPEVALEVEKRIRRGHVYTKICRQLRKKHGWKLHPQDISQWKRENTMVEIDGAEVDIKDFLDAASKEAAEKRIASIERRAKWAASQPQDGDSWRPDPRLNQSDLNVRMWAHGQRHPAPNRLELSGSVEGGVTTVILPESELFGETPEE